MIQSLLSLPYLLKSTDRYNCKSLRSVVHLEDVGVGFLNDTVNYFLRTYAKSGSINEANKSLRDTNKRKDEEETVYIIQFINSITRVIISTQAMNVPRITSMV